MSEDKPVMSANLPFPGLESSEPHFDSADSSALGENDTRDTCSLCDCLEDVITETIGGSEVSGWSSLNHRGWDSPERHQTQRAFFHQPCERCSSTTNDTLCSFCNHMRLKHLVQCLILADIDVEPRSSIREIDLDLGSSQGLEERSFNCDTCRLFAGPVSQMMNEWALSSNQSCVITIGKPSLESYPMKGVKCPLELNICLRDPKLRQWDDNKSKLIPTRTKRDQVSSKLCSHTPESKTFFVTTDPIDGHKLVSTPTPSAEVDWNKLSDWASDALGPEILGQERPDGPRPNGLRVIDTKQRCIALAPLTCKYATLSYVWGTTSKPLQAKTDNIQTLSTPAYLNSNVLPQTIEDAIVVCENIGIRYLWVDRLCILQDDDPKRKTYWLNAMGNIYSQSCLTIIALTGRDADYGLPGVGKLKRSAYWVGALQWIFLVSKSLSWDAHREEGLYGTRGWTLQEHMLASRTLTFSDTRVTYECRSPLALQDEICGVLSPYYQTLQGWDLCYGTLAAELTRRDLTHESDILRSFAGILYRVWGPHTYYGLPLSMFSDALLWVARDGSYPERRADFEDSFPSWSWASIKCPIDVQTPDMFKTSPGYWRDLRASLATWAIPPDFDQRPSIQVVANALGEPEGSNELELLIQLQTHDLEKAKNLESERTALSDPYNIINMDQLWRRGCEERACKFALVRIAVILAWKEGCFSAPLPNYLNIDATWDEFGRIATTRWRSLAELCDEAHGMAQGRMSEENIQRRFPSRLHKCPPGSILIYTQSLDISQFKLKSESDSDESGHFIEVGDFEAQVIDNSINKERISHTRQQNPDARFDLLALSMKIGALPMDETVWDENLWRDVAGKPLKHSSAWGTSQDEPLVVDLMVVETANGISRRVALARTFLKRWIAQNPQFHTFHLM